MEWSSETPFARSRHDLRADARNSPPADRAGGGRRLGSLPPLQAPGRLRRICPRLQRLPYRLVAEPALWARSATLGNVVPVIAGQGLPAD